MTSSNKYSVFIYRTIAVILLLSIWELNSSIGIYRLFSAELPSAFFPSLKTIAKSIYFQIFYDDYLFSLIVSISRVFYAFGIASILGILLGLLSARFKILDHLNFISFEFFRQLPGVAIIPFAILLFGIGAEMKIFVAFFGCFFPIYISTLHSLQNVDSVLLKTAKSYGWSGKKLLLGIMLPSALPGIISILRVTLSISLILIITSEMIVGGEGLGARIILKERSFDYAGLYAETFLLGIWGLILNTLFLQLTRRLLFWKPKLDWSNN